MITSKSNNDRIKIYMAKFDVLTVGGAVRDITFYTDQGKIFNTPDNLTAQKMLAFEYGAKINIAESYYGFGGGATNTAVSLTRLGLKTAAIIRLGKDEDAEDVYLNLKKERVNTSFIQNDNQNHTGLSFILGDKKDKDHVAFTYRGTNDNLVFQARKMLEANANWFYITSLSGPIWLKTLRLFFNFAQKNSIKVIWNPGNKQLQAGKKVLAGLLKQTSILILNKDEAIELVLSGIKVGRRSPNYLSRPLYLLNILKDWGPKIVVITEGKRGAYAFDGKNIYQQKAKRTKAADTTGVGDAFGSAFLAGFISSRGDIKKSLEWGILDSASVCSQIGSQNGLLTLEEMKRNFK